MRIGRRVVVHEVSRVVFPALTLRPTRAEASISFFSMEMRTGLGNEYDVVRVLQMGQAFSVDIQATRLLVNRVHGEGQR